VLVKGLILFLVVNIIFAAFNPLWLGRVSLYNHLFPGRTRLPFGEDTAHAYNLSLFNLDAMFPSQVIAAGPKPASEYRVIVVGDSSIWGTLLHPEETLAGQLDQMDLALCGKTVRVYNLGYPTISLMKDLMVLEYAMRYQPDLVVWATTLEAFPFDKQLSSPIVANNAAVVDSLVTRYRLPFSTDDPALARTSFWDKTIIGQRRSLADLFRLQAYGVLWAATGIDQVYPTDYPPAQTDFNTDVTFHTKQPPTLDKSQLAFSVLDAGMHAVGDVPVLLVNEPMLVGGGKNSDLRYNFFYPRWAYDQYREMLSQQALAGGWNYLDLWNLVPATEFTNSAIHLTPVGESLLAGHIGQAILQETCH
jgi:hypothetical protein